MRLKTIFKIYYKTKRRCRLDVNIYNWLPSKIFTSLLHRRFYVVFTSKCYVEFTSKYLRGCYNENVYVCFTSNPLRGVYHEILRVVYDESLPCALRGIYFVVNLTSHLRRNVGYDGRFTTKRVSRLIRRNTPFTTKLQRILPS